MKLIPKLALIFISFAILLLLGVGLLAYYRGRTALEAATFAELESTSVEKSAAIDTWAAERKSDIAGLSDSPAVLREFEAFLAADAATPLARDQLIKELSVRTGPGQPYLALFILSPDTGEILISTDPTEEGKFKEDQPYFKAGKSAPFVSTVYYSLQLQSPAISASAPLRKADGELLGVLAGRLNLEELNTIIQRRSGLRQSDDAFLVNASNLFVTQPHLLPDPAVLQRGIHTEAVQRCLRTRSNGTLSTLDYRNIPAIITYRWLPEHEMCLIVKMDQAEALAPVHAFGSAILWIALATLIVASGLAFVLARSMIRPILAMQATAQGYGRGQLEVRLPDTRKDELGVLAHEFNQMAAALAQKEMELRSYAQTLEQRVEERTRKLQESEARYRGLIESQSDLIVRVDPQGRFTFVNDAYCQKFGLEREAILGRESFQSLVHPEDLPHTLEGMEVLYQTPYRVTIEQRAFAVEGIRWIQWQDSAIRDESGRVVEIQAIGRDITERKRAEEALRESEAKYRNLFENMTEEVHFWKLVRDEAGSIKTWQLVDANRPTLETWGRKTIEEIKGKTTDEIFGPGAAAHYMPVVQKIMTEGLPYSYEDYFPHLDKFFHFTSVPLEDHFITTGSDITIIKKAEQELRESEQRLKRAQEIAHLGSWELDLVKNQLTWSDEVYRIFGLQPQEFGATYEAFLEAVHPEDRAAVNDAYSASIQEGRDIYEIEHRVVRRSSGEIRIVHEKCEHFRDQNGQIIRSVGMVHDITERKRAEEELQRTLEELKHSNAELEQFAYVASHDLQEPLRMVSSYMQLLKRRYQGKLDNDADEFIAFAVDGAARMQQLINDLLAFSRVGTRGRPMGLSSCEKVLGEALMNLQVAIEESKAIITHDPLPTVFCDQPQLVQVFQNLIGNSIKFRRGPGPQIHISAKHEENEWIFSICDNGIGLDSKFGERIFEIFQRLHSRTAYPGTGIGLAICKRIVQRHGGRIWVDSKPGEGATFYFTLSAKETL